MTVEYPLDPEAATGRVLDAHLHLLDRQVHDVASVPVTAVSDLELSDVDSIENVAPGARAVAHVGGRGGRPRRIPWVRSGRRPLRDRRRGA